MSALPVPFGRAPHLWDEAAVLAAIRDWTEKHGKPPSYHAWDRSGPDWPTASTVRHMFGSWRAGLAAAGVPTRNYRRTVPRKYSDEAILESIREAFAAGECTSRPFMAGTRRPYLAVIISRFGSWNQAVALAGVLDQQAGYDARLWSEEWLRREYVELGRGSWRIAQDIGCNPSTVCAALRRCGIPIRPSGGQRVAT